MAVQIILVCVFSYLIGSIPFSFLVAKFVKGVDIRVVGEGNVGGRNVWHIVGKKYGVIAGILDVLKGLAAYFIGYLLDLSPWWIWLCGVFVVLGHCFPIFLKGRGGKGISAAMGFLIGMEPLLILLSGVLWGTAQLVFRKFHLAASIGMASIPILWFVIWRKSLLQVALLVALLSILAIKRIIDEPYMKRIQKESGW